MFQYKAIAALGLPAFFAAAAERLPVSLESTQTSADRSSVARASVPRASAEMARAIDETRARVLADGVADTGDSELLDLEPAFGSASTVTLDVDGEKVVVSDDEHSDRVRCDHASVEDGAALAVALEEQAVESGRGRVVALVTEDVAEGLQEQAFEVEATIPGFYRGEEDCVVLGKSLDDRRPNATTKEELALVKKVLADKGAPVPAPSDVQSRRAIVEDAPRIAELLGETFEQYPTPSNDPDYVAEQIAAGAPFRLVEENGEIIACASADLIRSAKTAELTDCATRPACRGRGVMRRILADLMKDLRLMGYPTAFTLARAKIPGVNVAFARLGFELRGTMRQSCRIGEGLEDMNVWSRAL